MARSALLTVMVNAAFKAGRSLTRDFGEVENLQVSRKGPSDFVTSADLKAEKTLFEELSKGRPGYGFFKRKKSRPVGRSIRMYLIVPLSMTLAGDGTQLDAVTLAVTSRL